MLNCDGIYVEKFDAFYTVFLLPTFDTLSVIQVIYTLDRRVSVHLVYHHEGVMKINEIRHGLLNSY
jgi:hypothetical protein